MLAAIVFAVALAVYAGLGTVFALWFVLGAMDRFDSAARGAGVWFRMLIFPGAAALWPALAIRYLRRGTS